MHQIDQFRKIIDTKDKKIAELSSKNQVQKKEYESKIEELDRQVEEYRSIALKFQETLEKTQKEGKRTQQLLQRSQYWKIDNYLKAYFEEQK